MNKVPAIICSVLCQIACVQVGTRQTQVPDDHLIAGYSVMADTFGFKGYSVELIHADSAAKFCRVVLKIRKGNAVIDSLLIEGCDAVGGCSGIYVADEQPSKDYFVLSKFGDYDGRILIVDTSGSIQSFFGGHYFVSADNRYLFSPYSSDLPGLTVLDLSKNQVLYTSDTLHTYPADFYYSGSQYFATVLDDSGVIDPTRVAFFNFDTNKFILSKVDHAYMKKAIKLKGHSNITYGPCRCGQREE